MTVLRPLDPIRDAAELHKIFGDEELCCYLPEPAFVSVEETLAQLRAWTQGYEDTSWAIVDEPDGPALGRVALYQPREDKTIWEIGIMVVPQAQGHGLAFSAVGEAVSYGFDEKRASMIFADIDPDNSASIRVFEKLGFHFEGRIKAAWHTHIGARDSLIYSLNDSDERAWSEFTKSGNRFL